MTASTRLGPRALGPQPKDIASVLKPRPGVKQGAAPVPYTTAPVDKPKPVRTPKF